MITRSRQEKESPLESLYDKLKEYGESDYYPYHMPGHKRRAAGKLGQDITGIDITEIDGFDNLHAPEDMFVELQKKVSGLYGAEESFYLINGSTGGVLSAISAALPEGGHILMSRGSHKSAYHAAYLRRLKVSYIYPAVIDAFDICDAVTAECIEETLERQSGDIKAVFIVSPTYEGRIADVRRIAEMLHKRGIMLIVDEAHGAHLGMAEGFSINSCQAGADIVIHSVHKTLPALTQSALLHVNGKLADRERLKRFLHIYQSSSPSYILMAGIDNAVNILENDREVLFTNFYNRYSKMMDELKKCRNLSFVEMSKSQDIGKLVISGKRAGISGQEIYNLLLEKYHLQLEMASVSYCLAMFTIWDEEDAYVGMTEALLEIDRELDKVPKRDKSSDRALKTVDVTGLMTYVSDGAIPLWKAWDMDMEYIPLESAAGRYAGEFVNLYPPGIPLLVPGEKFTDRHCIAIADYVRQGLKVQGIEKHDGDKYIVKVIRAVTE
jgi:arginine/lysine/ornithine decarboxylase